MYTASDGVEEFIDQMSHVLVVMENLEYDQIKPDEGMVR